MKTDKVLLWRRKGHTVFPMNDDAYEWLKKQSYSKTFILKPVEDRDTKFHACFFSLLGFIWDNMPESFQKKVTKQNMYLLVKDLNGDFDIIHTKKDGDPIKKYHSISFGSLSQTEFEDKVRDYLDVLVNDILLPYKMYDFVDELNEEYKTFLDVVL